MCFLIILIFAIRFKNKIDTFCIKLFNNVLNLLMTKYTHYSSLPINAVYSVTLKKERALY